MTLQNVVDYLKIDDIDLFEGCTTPEPIDIELVKSYIMLRCGLLTPAYYEPDLVKYQTKMWFDKMQWEFDHLVKILLADYDPIDNVTEHINTTEMHSGTDKRKLGGNDRFSHGETHTLSGTDTLTHGETHTLSGTDTLTHGEKHTLSGTDTLTHGETHTLSGTDTNNDTTTTEHQVSAYNSGSYQADSKDLNGGYTNTQYGKVDTATGDDKTQYGKTDTTSGDDKTQYGKTDTTSGDDKTQYGRTDTASGTDQTLYGKTDDLTHGERIETRVYRHGNVGIVSPDDMIMKELDMLERFNVYDWIARKFERDNMVQVY